MSDYIKFIEPCEVKNEDVLDMYMKARSRGEGGPLYAGLVVAFQMNWPWLNEVREIHIAYANISNDKAVSEAKARAYKEQLKDYPYDQRVCVSKVDDDLTLKVKVNILED